MTCMNYLMPDPGDFGYTDYTGNGSTTDYAVGFTFLKQDTITAGSTSDYITVRVNAVEVPYTFVNQTTIRFGTAPANGTLIEIVRTSNLEAALVNWTNSSSLTAGNLALMNNQLQFLLQEIYMKLKGLGCEFNSVLEQIPSAVTEYSFTGNGSTTAFSLSPETSLTDAYCLVFVNGTRQATSAYNVAGSPSTLTFLSAPANGVAISVVVLKAQLVAYTVANGSIGTAQLADGSVTTAKLSLGGSSGNVLKNVSGTWQPGTVAASEVSGFDAKVVTNRISAMAAPNVPTNMGGQRIYNIAPAEFAGDAVEFSQMNSAISTAVAGVTAGNSRITTGTFTISGYTYTTQNVGFEWDWIIMRVVNTTVTITGVNYATYPVLMVFGTDGTGEQTIVYGIGNTFPGSTQTNTFIFQKITNGFQTKFSTGHVSNFPINVRFIAGKNV